MIIKRCTRCSDQATEPLFWVSVAWNRQDGERVAYKHSLCLTCVASKVVPIHTASELPTMTCPACGIDTSDDMDAIYITWIPKGVGKLRADAPFCGACAASYRVWFMEGAEKLEDRESSSRGQEAAPRYSAAQTLAALGIDVDSLPPR